MNVDDIPCIAILANQSVMLQFLFLDYQTDS